MSGDPVPSYTDDELARMHGALVDELAAARPFADPRVETAFRAVARHLFLPGVDAAKVYRNDAIATHWSETGRPLSSSTQPSLMAMMIEQLELRPGHRVLEIGAATGYDAAILRHIVGPEGRVVTIDIDAEIVASARGNLASAGVDDVEAVTADGGFGWPELAPYDRIIVTVGCPDIPPAWREQLVDDGILVMPLSIMRSFQRSIAFVRRGDVLTSRSQLNCGFITLRGAFEETGDEPPTLGDVPTIVLVPERDDVGTIDAGAILRMLAGPFLDIPMDIVVGEREVYFRVLSRCALRVPRAFHLLASGEAFALPTVPPLLEQGGDRRLAFGALAERGIGLIVRGDVSEGAENGIALHVRSYGEDERPARALAAVIRDWEDAGRPADEASLEVRALPAGTEVEASEGEIVVEKPSCVLVVRV